MKTNKNLFGIGNGWGILLLLLFFTQFTVFPKDDFLVDNRLFFNKKENVWYIEISVKSTKKEGAFLVIDSIGFKVAKENEPVVFQYFSYQFGKDPLIIFVSKNSAQYLAKEKIVFFTRKEFPLPKDFVGNFEGFKQSKVENFEIQISYENFYNFKKERLEHKKNESVGKLKQEILETTSD